MLYYLLYLCIIKYYEQKEVANTNTHNRNPLNRSINKHHTLLEYVQIETPPKALSSPSSNTYKVTGKISLH